VVSYTTVSPLPGQAGAVCSLLHFPEGHPWPPLTATLPCGARTFLDTTRHARRGRPADSSLPGESNPDCRLTKAVFCRCH
jgi:hypothetical protein